MPACKRLLQVPKQIKPNVWMSYGLLMVLLVTLISPAASQNPRRARRSAAQSTLQVTDSNLLPLSQADASIKAAPEALTVLGAGPRRHRAATLPATATAGTSRYFAFNIEFDSDASQRNFTPPGPRDAANVFNRYQRFADVFIRADTQGNEILKTIAGAPGVVWLEQAGAVEVPPPVRPRRGGKARGEAESIALGGVEGFTGKGVVIAIVDSGLDFRNPDFITYDAQGRPTSRLLYLWDTTNYAFNSQRLGGKGPISFPNGTSVGTVYTREQLTQELRASVKRIPATDLNGHGTACAGIAAGNGNNHKHTPDVMGVAPDADIIGVRIGGDAGFGLQNAFLLPAIAGWLDTVVGKKPLVVSCSFGGHRGGHDGTLIEERQLDARFPSESKGRALVVAAGNEAGQAFHARVNFQNRDAPGRLFFQAGMLGAEVQIYLDSDDVSSLKMGLANKTVAKSCGINVNPFTHQAIVCVEVGPGPGGIAMADDSGRARHADAYIHSQSLDYGFVSDTASPEGLVGTPGTAQNAITVGSYDWNDQFEFRAGVATSVPGPCSREPVPLVIGYLSCYSSPGFTRNGGVKPDIVAPGQYFRASYAKLPSGGGVNQTVWQSRIDASGNYCLFDGTSAATPYVAGVIALMFQKKPTLTIGEIKTLFKDKATEDQITGPLPNPKWGNGKLDLTAIKKMLDAIR